MKLAEIVLRSRGGGIRENKEVKGESNLLM
jgi:hypothetical protein